MTTMGNPAQMAVVVVETIASLPIMVARAHQEVTRPISITIDLVEMMGNLSD